VEEWRDENYIAKYLQAAQALVVDRERLLELLKSFFKQNFDKARILDLGCGDGILSSKLLEVKPHSSATLVDASPEMLDLARKRLKGCNASFINASFQELLRGRPELGEHDMAVSMLAIHHLSGKEKEQFFKFIYRHLGRGGAFVNMDNVLPPEGLEDWYLKLWENWVVERQEELGLSIDYQDFRARYLAREHHSRLDSLEMQLKALREAGFKDVDCFYKNGIFAMFGGRTLGKKIYSRSGQKSIKYLQEKLSSLHWGLSMACDFSLSTRLKKAGDLPEYPR